MNLHVKLQIILQDFPQFYDAFLLYFMQLDCAQKPWQFYTKSTHSNGRMDDSLARINTRETFQNIEKNVSLL